MNNEYEDAYIMSPKREKKFIKIKLGNAVSTYYKNAFINKINRK